MGMKPRPPKPKCKWRDSGDGSRYHYYEDDKFGHGYVHPTIDNSWYACAPGKGANIFRLLRNAKKYVEGLID